MEPEEHIAGIFKEYTTPSRVLRSFTNLSNTVIQTALSGQNKFIFELLQNADDAYDEGLTVIEMKLILDGSYLIVHHNGKGFDYNDVERICDYASQIEEVKANDLSKTGYKGLGFKSLFNLSDCIYICSNGYSFRFDKNYWPDPENKPWQVIPIWCVDNELPLQENYSYTQKVNIILKVENVKLLENQLKELIEQPDLLLFLHRINTIIIYLNGREFCLKRLVENFGSFKKIRFLKNRQVVSSWLTRTFNLAIPIDVRKLIQGASQFVYPEKIKTANEVSVSYAISCDESYEEIKKIDGLCFSTLPTQLHLSLPYHLNCSFILNLDRTQLHENEWNCFLISSVGRFQLYLLKDLAGVEHLRNYVIVLLVRRIQHQFSNFCTAFFNSYESAKNMISWLPCYEKSCLLKLGEAWTDEIDFFKQKFQNIKDDQIVPYLIDYDVKNRNLLSQDGEAQHFTFKNLFRSYTSSYRQQFNSRSHLKFISYLYERVKFNTYDINNLKSLPFLISKDKQFISPSNAMLEDDRNPIPEFFMLNAMTVDNECLPRGNRVSIKYWLQKLGAHDLTSSLQILKKSVFAWIDDDSLYQKITLNNHCKIIQYMAEHSRSFSWYDFDKLKQKLIVLTESKQFKYARLCYVNDATTIKELSNVISDKDKISSMYDMHSLREFFIQIGVHDRLDPIDVLRKSILAWIHNGTIKSQLTLLNYKPIIKFFAVSYPFMERHLTQEEKMKLRELPVLTCNNTLRVAKMCYFKEAIPECKELEFVIDRSELVYTENFSEVVIEFCKKIGVSGYMSPSKVLQRSVLKWIKEGTINQKITKKNNLQIILFIAEKWTSLKEDEKEFLKKFPLWTKNDSFNAACKCYFSTSSKIFNHSVKIPGLEEVFTPGEIISDSYFTPKKDMMLLPNLFSHLGVRFLEFDKIYEKYSNHLSKVGNVKWFFSELTSYWEKYKQLSSSNKLLVTLRNKFNSSSCLLAKNGKLYSSTALYSSQFLEMGKINPDLIPILEYDLLPTDLERYFNIKYVLELSCIIKLLEAVSNKPKLGNAYFFKVILEQLRNKSRRDLNNCRFHLLSEENKMILAKELYFFRENDVSCKLLSCYLKRVNGMSHDETLELAELCGVNILPFNQEILKVDTKVDNSLKKFYLDRLPFIVFQESKRLNESETEVLKGLYEKVCSMKLFQCKDIHLQYPFGEPVKVQHHFNKLMLYVTRQWIKQRSKIHDYLIVEFGFLTDIKDIIDMNPFEQNDLEAFLEDLSEEDYSTFKAIVEEFLAISKRKNTNWHFVLHRDLNEVHHSNFRRQQHLDIRLSTSNELPFTVNLEDSNFQNETFGQGDNFQTKTVTQFGNFPNETVIQVSNFQNEIVTQASNFQNETVAQVSNFQNEIVTQAGHFQNETVRNVHSGVGGCVVPYLSHSIVSLSNFEKELLDKILSKLNEVPVTVHFQDNILHDESIRQVYSKKRNRTRRAYSQFSYKTTIEATKFVSNSSVAEGSPAQENYEDASHFKMLGKKYVFAYLQDYYKNKHPDLMWDLQDGQFSIGEGSNRIEITLLKDEGFDILLKKCGEIDEIIEVEVSSLKDYDTFQISCCEFIEKIGHLGGEFYQNKEKYHIYYVFCTNDFSVLSDYLEIPLLFMILPLKMEVNNSGILK